MYIQSFATVDMVDRAPFHSPKKASECDACKTELS